MSLEDMCDQPVLFQNVINTPDTSGDTGSQTLSAGTTVYASIQPDKSGRVIAHGGVEYTISHRLYFAAEPIDVSSGARAGGRCSVMDLMTDTNDGRTFYSLGISANMAGRGVGWRADCVLRG